MKIFILLILITVISLIIMFLIGSVFGKNNSALSFNVFVGFSLLMVVFFIITHYAVDNQFSSQQFHILMGIASIVIGVLSLKSIKKVKINKFLVVFIVAYVLFAVLLSLRYSLGEQMGDNIYLFQVVNKNIDILRLNSYDLGTGYVDLNTQPGLNKSYISFYMMFSSLYYFIQPLIKLFGITYLPPYVLNMWIANLIFYFFSAGFILDLIHVVNIKKKLFLIMIIIWLGLYTGSIYYNITLPHIVVTYLVLFASYLTLMLFEYFKTFDRLLLLKIFIVLFAMNAFGGTGALFLMVFSFGIVVTTMFLKHKDAFIQIPLFLIPILEYVFIMIKHDRLIEFVFFGYLLAIVFCLVFYFNAVARKILFITFPYLLVILWLGLIGYSILRIDMYWDKFFAFTTPQYAADRTQDYFSFSSSELITRNLFYYILICILFLKDKTRPIGIMILVVLLFFVNPFMKPIVAENIARYDVYNRIFFTVFNSGSIGLGLYVLYDMLEKYAFKFSKFVIICIIIIMFVPTINQVTGYYYPTYEPQVSDYNSLYKMGDSQIEILEAVRQVVVIEELENPKIVSQIFGTAMYAPEFVTLGYNVNQQRYGPLFIGQALYEIFYTPAIPGDHRPKVNYDLRTTCQLLVDLYVDFVIIDKSFSVYDEQVGDYLTIYWYIERCGASFVYENDDYIAYRFYRW